MSNNKDLRKTLKQPDQFQAELIKGFKWTTSHSKLVLGAVILFVVAAAAYTTAGYIKTEKETKVQEKYYSFERQYLEKKAAFEKPESKDKKETKITATGDLQKDFGSAVEGFESLVKEFPNSLGGQMSALHLSDLYMSYKKPEDALRVLKAVQINGSSEMLAALVLNQLGNVYAQQNDCKNAIEQWQTVVNSKKLAFAHDEAKLRMGLCFETMNDIAKAEQMYTEVSKKEGSSDFSASRDAEKYLRLLKMKKNL